MRFEGSRCTEYSEDTYGPCADVDRSSFTFPVFEYYHVNYDSSPSSEEDYTGGNDICGDGSIVGNAAIGKLTMTRLEWSEDVPSRNTLAGIGSRIV